MPSRKSLMVEMMILLLLREVPVSLFFIKYINGLRRQTFLKEKNTIKRKRKRGTSDNEKLIMMNVFTTSYDCMLLYSIRRRERQLRRIDYLLLLHSCNKVESDEMMSMRIFQSNYECLVRTTYVEEF